MEREEMLVPVTEQDGLRLHSSRWGGCCILFMGLVVVVFGLGLVVEVVRLIIPGGGARALEDDVVGRGCCCCCCCCASRERGGMASTALLMLLLPSLLRNLRKVESSWEGLVDRKMSMLSPRFLGVVEVGMDLVEGLDGDDMGWIGGML